MAESVTLDIPIAAPAHQVWTAFVAPDERAR